MAKNFKKGLSAFLAALMCTSTMSLAVHAEDTSNFTAMNLGNIVSSGDEYNYMIAQDLDDEVYYYATSNHAVKIANAGAVHIFPIIDTTRDVVNGTWEADGIYVSGESNYDVVYCCDFSTGTRVDEEDATRTYYKRLNLEDSEYFSDELAERLRAIVSVSYPANSVEDAKAALKVARFERADELDRSELISATQGAIWRLANADSIIDGVTDFRYRTTVQTSRKAGWGGYMHNYTLSGEQMNFTDGKKDTVIAEIGSRINALQDFFLTSDNEAFLAKGKAEDNQIVITDIDMVGRQLSANEESEQVMVFKDRLKEKRVEAGLTQAELATRAGVTARTIQNYELGNRKPANMEVIQKIADALGTTTEYLLGSSGTYVVEAHEKGGSKAARDIDELVSEVAGMFASGKLSEEALEGAMKALNDAYWIAKEKNKKYGRRKSKEVPQE